MIGTWLLAASAARLVAAAPPPVAAAETAVASSAPTVVLRLPRPVLALTTASAGRVALLEDDRVSIWRWQGPALSLLAEWPAGPLARDRVRRPGGLIREVAGTPDFWVLRSGWPEARLVSLEDGSTGVRVASESAAAVVTWPSAPDGLRFRAGTNLIEGSVDGLGVPGPYTAVVTDGTAAVDAEGRLIVAGTGRPSDLRVGMALARVWPGLLVASSPQPTAPDALLAITQDPPLAVSVADVPGTIRALCARVERDGAMILASVDAGGEHQILRLDLRRRTERP